MKRNLHDYPKFYRWLTLPFTKKPSRIQVLKRMNRILTLVMPGVYGMVFCWLFLKKTSLGGIWPSMCVCQLSLPLGMCSMLLSLLLALVRVLGGVHYPKDVLVALGLGLVWGGLFLLA